MIRLLLFVGILLPTIVPSVQGQVIDIDTDDDIRVNLTKLQDVTRLHLSGPFRK
jgi:hypothetical protein